MIPLPPNIHWNPTKLFQYDSSYSYLFLDFYFYIVHKFQNFCSTEFVVFFAVKHRFHMSFPQQFPYVDFQYFLYILYISFSLFFVFPLYSSFFPNETLGPLWLYQQCLSQEMFFVSCCWLPSILPLLLFSVLVFVRVILLNISIFLKSWVFLVHKLFYFVFFCRKKIHKFLQFRVILTAHAVYV